jgi:hypothetical protein
MEQFHPRAVLFYSFGLSSPKTGFPSLFRFLPRQAAFNFANCFPVSQFLKYSGLNIKNASFTF